MNTDENNSISNKHTIEGVVVKKSGDKTVSVEVVRTVRHAIYNKGMKRTKRYLAHDPNNTVAVGDKVTIRESRPLSRRKRFVVITSTKA